MDKKFSHTFRAAVKSMRLRTLPLSLSGVLLGVFLALPDYRISLSTVIFLLLTTASLQILSNLSNELGDFLRGTDRDDRQGPVCSLQAGELDVRGMKRIIAMAIVSCIVFGLAMIRSSFGTLFSMDSVCLMLLGAAAMGAAMKYTLGRNPYGYRGLGDVYVFLFFGIVSVLGAYWVVTHYMSVMILLPASAIGFFSVGVLNVNNIRDMKSDESTRVTLAIRLGGKWSRIYQTVVIVLGWVCMFVYCSLRLFSPWHYLFVLSLPLFVRHLHGVWTKSDRELDPMLPLLVAGTFLFMLLTAFGYNFDLIFG